MVDVNGDVIYIGKAKSLRGRLLSYFRRTRERRAGRTVRQACAIVWEPWPCEFAALLRELELIRRWRPRCNVQGQPLRRRMAFVCLEGAPAAFVSLRRRPSDSVNARFGPISAGPRAVEAIRRLNDFFQLRDCPAPQEMVFRGDKRLFMGTLTPGCLRLEIGTCLGPCAAACTQAAYQERVASARAFLERRDDGPLTQLEKDMAAAALALEFERAAVLRDQLESLRWLARKLDQLRQVRGEYSFIYPVRGHDRRMWWFAIHGGRTMAVLPEPRTPQEKQAAAERLRAIYIKPSAAALLEGHEHIDGMLVVASWFRRKPAERKRTLTPADALRHCQ
jgi:excinuclease ABC subunit C